jgi:eukaryotic-like serine/threonine-protein kinase
MTSPMTSPNNASEWIGRHVGHQKRYRIDDVLGSGGMGTVFLAKDVLLGKTLALKVLKATLSDDSSFRQRFEREVSVCAALASEHIVRIDDYGITEEGYPYFAMERLTGETLAQRLSYRGILSIDASISIISQVCLGLQTAHRGVSLWVKGEATEPIKIIHRDLKPENIFLVPTGLGDLVKILDFGIAKISDDHQNEQSGGLTGTDMFIGTFDYASPEQVSGSRKIDERSDIYSLGMILYRMLSGTDPFGLGRSGQRTSGINWAVAHATKPPEALREQPNCLMMPPQLEQIVMRCIEKAPEDRFASVDELRQALLNFAASRACPDAEAAPTPAPTVLRDKPQTPPEPPSRTSVEVPRLDSAFSGSSGTAMQPPRTSEPGPVQPQPATVLAISQNQPVAELPIAEQPIVQPVEHEQHQPALDDLNGLHDPLTNAAIAPSAPEHPAIDSTVFAPPAPIEANGATSMEVPVLAPPTNGHGTYQGTSVETPRLSGGGALPELAPTSVTRPLTSETQISPSLSRPVQPIPPQEQLGALPTSTPFPVAPVQPKRGLPIPLLAGGGALLLSLVAGGGFATWQWSQSQAANQRLAEIRQFKTSANFKQCITSATDFSGPTNLANEATLLLNQCRLGLGKALADDKKFDEALTAVLAIPSTDPNFKEAKTLLDKWSNQLITQATELYNTKGSTDAAVALLNKIPEASSLYAKAKDLAAKWQEDTTFNRQALKLAQTALDEKRWQSALNEADRLRANTPHWQSQKAKITSKANAELDRIAAQQRRQQQETYSPAPQNDSVPPPRPYQPDPPPPRPYRDPAPAPPPPPRPRPNPPPANDSGGDLCTGQSNLGNCP